MLVERPPGAALAPWVTSLWVARERDVDGAAHGRERLVPSGAFHLVLRLDDSRIRIFDTLEDERGRTYTAVVGGARARFHLRQATPGARAIGIQLRPGAAGVVLGVPAEELAERHTALEELWGREAGALRERLCDAGSAAAQVALLEQFVAARLQPRLAPHPAVREALARFVGDRAAGWRVGPVRGDTGLSHRRFVQLFRRQVGIGPKQLCRVLRLAGALRRVRRGPPSWADIAAASGYCDQSHLVRELRAIAGVSPSELMASARAHLHHIPVVNFVQARARAQG